jgi:hypothetical protein
VYRYVIEVEDAAGNWTPIVNRRANTNVAAEFTDEFPAGTTARLHRIVFSPFPDHLPIQLDEVHVLGAPIQ